MNCWARACDRLWHQRTGGYPEVRNGERSEYICNRLWLGHDGSHLT